ncbi:xanthine dehydrogenase small subunit [Ornithinicoccus halotolerans]|uniref:xanthine dehydrogenase small subunit n=1 Tax=Ornithinicoccus halotolerans TaxID=1748220 RepID=UPI00129762EF|nr:FAD binding domain-containing protein [Ornithinicoccus halotolerans]
MATETETRTAGTSGEATSTPAVVVNGRPVPLDPRVVAAHTTTLDWLRSQRLTGAKEGCAEGECGACAVLLARADGRGGTCWTAVNACLIPAAALDGQEVITAEGLGTPERLHEVQREMAARGGSQCGYCTPGFVCAMAAEYYRDDRGEQTTADAALDGTPAADHEVGPNGFDLHALSGNLCRCTGYRPIKDAAFALGRPAPEDPLAQRLRQPAPAPRPTRLAGDEGALVRPADLAEALRLLAAEPRAVLLAGATDWGVEVNIGHRRAPLVIAVDQLPELRELGEDRGALTIGAALSLSELERRLAGRVPLLDALMPLFASRLIRNGATLGGNLGTASPIGDAAPVLLALEADVVLTSTRGERTVPVSEYFTGFRQTQREPDELIRAVRVPVPPLPVARFSKVAKRRYDDISSVAVGIAAREREGRVERVRIGLGGVAATPVRARDTEAALEGGPWTPQAFAEAAEVMAGEGTPMSDHRASAGYRAAMLRQALLRFHHETQPEVAR